MDDPTSGMDTGLVILSAGYFLNTVRLIFTTFQQIYFVQLLLFSHFYKK